ncbi:MAG: adenosylcobalamin-dependent ribonucleoside-diphosphate reductase [Litoreibacter sp.]
MFDHIGTSITPGTFDQLIADQIWRAKYQYKNVSGEIDRSVSETWLRVAQDLSQPENAKSRNSVTMAFYEAMVDFKLLPAGRILSGSGTSRNVTLSNTFVMKTLPDSVDGIMDVIKDAALTMQMGGGIGFDFSTLRPKGTLVQGLDCPAAGPLAVMDICDAVCKMLVTGMGRGAMMATMRCDHPDIEEFIKAKSDPTRMRNFNMSVMITDVFMAAVDADADWALIWDGIPIRRIKARTLWNAIMQQTYAAAEPGVLFIDRINAKNPLNYLEHITATNSCAEQPLPPNGTCPLASINLAKLVTAPFGDEAKFNTTELRDLVSVAVRMLDNAIDVSKFAVDAQTREAQDKRRIGIGVTGVADALIMLGIRYGSKEAEIKVGEWMRCIQNAAYLASTKLAAERGAFALFDKEKHMRQPAIKALDPDVRAAIETHGLRNGTLTTIAPTGTTSMLGGNVSSGIEPVFAASYKRKMTKPDGTSGEDLVQDYAVWLFHQMFGKDTPLTNAFVTAQDLSPDDHVRMQAAAQVWVDSGISKTVNCPEDISFDAFKDIYREAYALGCKGCTTYRPNDVTGSILTA